MVPPSFDTDDDDHDDYGLKPCELYKKYTWKISKLSEINNRYIWSEVFAVGGYKWCILLFPKGCNAYNHLSIFLCVADYQKLLPGWSHFAQFTISLLNKDPKKSRFADVLHRFWRKEHDWGWKKFMVLSKVVNDGFVDDDALTVNAQVQVIREKIDRPFRCLGSIYRRELVSIYWSKVEQIYHQIVKKIRGQFENLLEDKVRWSSFCNIWLGADQEYRHRLSRVKSDFLLKAVVKLIFIEKEVTSTLLMDSLYNGLRALKGQTKSNTVKGKCDAKELPLVQMESDTFILVDDVLTLLGRAVLEPLPLKDENGPQNCTQDGGSWKDFVENKERRLAELGQRTIELIVLAYISSKIDLASQEALALKRQEELIREEEMEKAAKQSRHQNQNEKQKQKQKRACDKRSKG